VKEANLRHLHKATFQQYVILERRKLWRKLKKKNQWLPGDCREGEKDE
jgi:hypothetical protein